MYIAIWCTYCKLHFNMVSKVLETLVIALHQFFHPFTVEWCRLLFKAHVNGFFDPTVFVEPLASKEGFKMQEQMKLTWR